MNAAPGLAHPLAIDVLGWAAAALTLVTFASGSMVRLRLVALTANSSFFA